CPVFSTYKAKGVMPDADPLLTGYYIGGAAEEETMKAADLVLMLGADPVEFPPSPYKYGKTPVLELTTIAFPRSYYTPALTVLGDLADAASKLATTAAPSKWSSAELAKAKDKMLKAAAASDGGPISPQLLVEMTCAAMPADARV